MTDDRDDTAPEVDHELEQPADPNIDQQAALQDAVEQEQDRGSAASGA